MQRDIYGRPKSNHIYTKMDLMRKGQPNRCGVCHNEGHSKNKYPTNTRSSKQPKHFFSLVIIYVFFIKINYNEFVLYLFFSPPMLVICVN